MINQIPETYARFVARQRAEHQAERERILNDPAPTEKFRMVYPTGVTNRVIQIFNLAGKQIGAFAPTPSLRKIFGGRLIITVKAKIIDGQFELIKVLP